MMSFAEAWCPINEIMDNILTEMSMFYQNFVKHVSEVAPEAIDEQGNLRENWVEILQARERVEP